MPRGRSKGYTNRTDLQMGKPMPVSAPTGMPYGDNKALRDAQRAVPMAGTSAPKPPAAAPATPAANAAPVVPTNPSVTPLTAPTQRPSETIMTGVNNSAPMNEIQQLKNNYLSYFQDATRGADVPEQFNNFVMWLRNQ